MENNIEKVKSFYESKNYDAAFDICINLLKEGKCKKDAYLFAAKCSLFKLKNPMDKESNNIILNTFKNACAEAKNIEEVLELEREMTVAFYEWKAESIKAQLTDLENNPTLELWKKYYPSLTKYIELEIFISVYARNCQAANEYCAENGIEKKEFDDTIKKNFGDRFKTAEVITNEEIATLEYETAQRIFENTQTKLSANNEGNKDFIIEVSNIIVGELLTAQCIVSDSLPKKGTNPSIRCERLALKADITSYLLSAMIYPNGTPLSLYMGDRTKYIEEIKEIYSEIKEFDPSFEPPALPNVEAVRPQKANGGCYVATAVYGSYDCPEVWTLRRFRDNILAETWYGRAFIRTYYVISPTLVKWFGKNEWFKNIWKPALDKMVSKLNGEGVESTPYNDRTW